METVHEDRLYAFQFDLYKLSNFEFMSLLWVSKLKSDYKCFFTKI